MKKQVLFLFMLLSFVQVYAQDTSLLQRIMEASNAIESIKSDLHHRKDKDGNIKERDGVYYYTATDKFAALFDDGNYMVINGDQANMNIGIFHENIRMKHGPVRSLSQVFLYAFQGRCAELAEINNFSLGIRTLMGFHVVTMTTNKKYHIGMGLQQVVFKFGVSDLLVKEIVLTDYKGTVNTYTLRRPQYNVRFDQSVFSTSSHALSE